MLFFHLSDEADTERLFQAPSEESSNGCSGTSVQGSEKRGQGTLVSHFTDEETEFTKGQGLQRGHIQKQQ